MRRLLRFLKLADILDKNNDIKSLKTLCAYFNGFIKKHNYVVSSRDVSDSFRRNMDYSDYDNSPYFGSIEEFIKKFPNGIEDWLKWRRDD